MSEKQTIRRMRVHGKVDPDVCPNCCKRNTNNLQGSTHECYDCGTTYEIVQKATRKEIIKLRKDLEAEELDENKRHMLAHWLFEGRRTAIKARCSHPKQVMIADCCWRCPDCGDNWS